VQKSGDELQATKTERVVEAALDALVEERFTKWVWEVKQKSDGNVYVNKITHDVRTKLPTVEEMKGMEQEGQRVAVLYKFWEKTCDMNSPEAERTRARAIFEKKALELAQEKGWGNVAAGELVRAKYKRFEAEKRAKTQMKSKLRDEFFKKA